MVWGGAIGAVAITGGFLTGSAALAADWQVTAASGKAFRLSGTGWVAVAAGEPLALGDSVKTLGSGTLVLQRNGVTVTVGPNSQVQIAERMDGKFTDVFQTVGSATVEVDPQKHIHLAVETPYMAAVVKGTVFTVATSRGHSQTTVARGRVAVVDVANRLHADVTAGQKADAGVGQPLSLSGSGRLEAPVTFAGKVMSRAADGTLSEIGEDASNGAANGKAKGADDDGKVSEQRHGRENGDTASDGSAASHGNSDGGDGNSHSSGDGHSDNHSSNSGGGSDHSENSHSDSSHSGGSGRGNSGHGD